MLFLSLGPALQVYTLLVVSDNTVWHDCLLPSSAWGWGLRRWVMERVWWMGVQPQPRANGAELFMPPSIIWMRRLQIRGISLPRSYPVSLGRVHLSWCCCKSIFPRLCAHLRGTGPKVVALGMEGAGTTCARQPGRLCWRW